MSVKDILGDDGKILPSYISGGGGGGVNSVNGAPNSQINVADPTTDPKISVAFTQAEQMLIGNGAGQAKLFNKGANGQVLYVKQTGELGWENVSPGGITQVNAGDNIRVNTPSVGVVEIELQSPLTTELNLGNVPVRSTNGQGLSGQVLSSTGAGTQWINTAGGTLTGVDAGAGLAITNGQTTTPQVNLAFAAGGDLIVGTGPNAGVVLTKGANGTFLQVNNAGALAWGAGGGGGGVVSVAGGPNGLINVADGNADAKVSVAFVDAADLLVGTGANTGKILPKGTANQVLKMNAGANDIVWADAPSGNITAATLPLVKTTAGNVDTFAIDFSPQGRGQLACGVNSQSGKEGSILLASPSAGYVLTADADAQNLTGLKWAAQSGGSGTVTNVAAGNGLTITGDASTTPTVNLGFINNGDLLYGTSSNTGAVLGIGSAGQVLTVANGVPSWAPNAGSSTTIFRNNTPFDVTVTKPASSTSTCIVVCDFVPETQGGDIDGDIYDNLLTPTGTTDILQNPSFFFWTIGPGQVTTGTADIFDIEMNIEITASAAGGTAQMQILGPGSPQPVLATFPDVPVPIPIGTNQPTFTGGGSPVLLRVVSGETYVFVCNIVPPSGGGATFTYRGQNINNYAGGISAGGKYIFAAGSPAPFKCTQGTSFRKNQSTTGFTTAICQTASSQSFVASSNANDWVQVGALNAGVAIS